LLFINDKYAIYLGFYGESMNNFQRTLKRSVSFAGVGVHSGNLISVEIRPASANTGIIFQRTDLPNKPYIKANALSVYDTSMATRIGTAQAHVSTIEHLMAAFFGFGIDNAIISIDADLQDPPEVIEGMLELWKEGSDIVYGVRTVREGETWFKLITAKLFYIIVRKLMLINCKISFLLLDRKDMCENRLIMYKHVIEYAKIYNLDYIELYNNSNVTELLRDDVHTNEAGAIFYSNEFFNYFMKNMIDKPINYTNIPEETNELYNIEVFKVDKQIDNEIIIRGNFKIIGIFQKLGTFSGLVEISSNNENSYKFNVWDQWCYFERNSIKIKTNWEEQVKIKILQDSFDTELCKNKDIKFNDIQKFMHIHEIFYIGNLNIVIN
jgi:hypothetical protein